MVVFVNIVGKWTELGDGDYINDKYEATKIKSTL